MNVGASGLRSEAPLHLGEFFCFCHLHLYIVNGASLIFDIQVEPDAPRIHVWADALLRFRIFYMVYLQIRQYPL